MDNKSLSHTRWKCQYHIVFIPKIPKEGIVWENTQRKTLCQYKNVEYCMTG